MAQKLKRCLYPMCAGLTTARFCVRHADHEHKNRRRCAFPGCGTLVPLKKWYCEPHEKMKALEKERERGSARSRGYGARWDAVSKAYRAAHPLCEPCLRLGRTSAVELVHHKVPVSEGGDWFDWNNLESQCKKCHSRQPGHGHFGSK